MGQFRDVFFLAHDSQNEAAEFQKCVLHVNPNAILHHTNHIDQIVFSVRRLIPDIIFLNTNIGGISSEQTLKQMKCDPDLKNIPVVIYSTPKSTDEVKEYYDLGAARYFEQPVSAGGIIFGLEIIFYLLHKSQLVRPEFEQFLLATNHHHFAFRSGFKSA